MIVNGKFLNWSFFNFRKHVNLQTERQNIEKGKIHYDKNGFMGFNFKVFNVLKIKNLKLAKDIFK